MTAEDEIGLITTYHYDMSTRYLMAVTTSDGTGMAYTYDNLGRQTSAKPATVTSSGYTSVYTYNPFRYRGYYYDTETGFYYLQSRYYDPTTGRWLNSDLQLNTSLGILGNNLFSYCLNNPINMTDYTGNKPGDIFDSPDEAAVDFANYINTVSIEKNREYASYIYSVKVKEKRTITLVNPNILKSGPLSWLYKLIFGDNATKTITVEVEVTKYTYRKPKKGKIKSSRPQINWFGIHNVVGRLHTHGAYDPSYESDQFSAADINIALDKGVLTYVATPGGYLFKYDPETCNTYLISKDIPFDPNHPWRQ